MNKSKLYKLKPMLTILLLTVIALVVIAAGVQLCRPKDHGEYEPMYKISEFSLPEHTDDNRVEVRATMQVDSLTAAMLDHLQDEFNYKP